MIVAAPSASDPTLIEQMAPVIASLSGVLALVGVVIGHRLDRGKTSESWRRDRRLSAYTRFLEVMAELQRHYVEIWTADPIAREGMVDDLFPETVRFDVLHLEVTLLGPKDVRAAAEAAYEAARSIGSELYEMRSRLDWDLAVQHAHGARWAKVKNDFREAAIAALA